MNGSAAMRMPSRCTSARWRSARRALGADHPDLAASLNNLASLYQAEGRTADAVPIVEQTIASGRAQPRVALPVLLSAQQQQLMPAGKALDDALNVVQRGTQSSAAPPSTSWRCGWRRDRPSRATGAPGSGSRRGSGDAGQGDRCRRLEGTCRSAMPRPSSAAGNGLPPFPPSAQACKKRLQPNFPIMPRCRIRCR